MSLSAHGIFCTLPSCSNKLIFSSYSNIITVIYWVAGNIINFIFNLKRKLCKVDDIVLILQRLCGYKGKSIWYSLDWNPVRLNSMLRYFIYSISGWIWICDLFFKMCPASFFYQFIYSPFQNSLFQQILLTHNFSFGFLNGVYIVNIS